jgi:hypothetical protein
MMDTLALWIGYAVLTAAGLAVTAGALYAAVYWITYAVNESHHRAAASIAGKDYLKLLRKAMEEQEVE